MKALVTGGTGFTGSNLVRSLIEKGVEVRVLARPTSKTDFLEDLDAEIVIGDISERDDVDRAVKGMDKVFNIAAAFRESNLPERAYWAVNYDGTRNILEACVKYDVSKLVHCSTIGVVSSVTTVPSDETAPYSPGDVYQQSKCEAEKEVLRFAREKKLPASVIRPCAIYGPGDMRLLKMFRMIARKKFYVLGSGKALYHMVYINDLVSGFILASEKEKAVGEVFIIGGDKYTTLNELFRIIADEFKVRPPKIHLPYKPIEVLSVLMEYAYKPLKKEPPLYKRRVAFFKKDRAFNISKAKRILGYMPEFDLRKGIHLTAKWYMDNGYI
ncbi:MAG: NAD-dependent epimerase/dehydratase family protein [Actinobacteria bacterium]|nr:NAD-dependent epimerase/dehydratase family protein [Actinomycetota bacterium]